MNEIFVLFAFFFTGLYWVDGCNVEETQTEVEISEKHPPHTLKIYSDTRDFELVRVSDKLFDEVEEQQAGTLTVIVGRWSGIPHRVEFTPQTQPAVPSELPRF